MKRIEINYSLITLLPSEMKATAKSIRPLNGILSTPSVKPVGASQHQY